MKIIVRAKAEDDTDLIFAWIAKDNPSAAARVVRLIRHRIATLADDKLARMGRPGLISGTLELVVYPYVIVYKISPIAASSSSSPSSTARRSGNCCSY